MSQSLCGVGGDVSGQQRLLVDIVTAYVHRIGNQYFSIQALRLGIATATATATATAHSHSPQPQPTAHSLQPTAYSRYCMVYADHKHLLVIEYRLELQTQFIERVWGRLCPSKMEFLAWLEMLTKSQALHKTGAASREVTLLQDL